MKFDSVDKLYEAYKEREEGDKEKERLYGVLMNVIFAVQAERIRRQLDRAQKMLFGFGFVAALGIFVFVWAANPPAAEDTSRPDSELSQLSKRIKAQQRDIDSLSHDIHDLDQKVEDQQKDVSSISRRVNSLAKRTDSLSNAVRPLQTIEAIRRALQER
jgi:peptidoglycan hydrolase CwlO-like protein